MSPPSVPESPGKVRHCLFSLVGSFPDPSEIRERLCLLHQISLFPGWSDSVVSLLSLSLPAPATGSLAAWEETVLGVLH